MKMHFLESLIIYLSEKIIFGFRSWMWVTQSAITSVGIHFHLHCYRFFSAVKRLHGSINHKILTSEDTYYALASIENA